MNTRAGWGGAAGHPRAGWLLRRRCCSNRCPGEGKFWLKKSNNFWLPLTGWNWPGAECHLVYRMFQPQGQRDLVGTLSLDVLLLWIPAFPWSAAFPELSNNLPSDVRGLRWDEHEKFASCLKQIYFFFRFINLRKNNHGLGHMSQGDHFFWLPGHTHTLTPPRPPCLWQPRHTNNSHSWLARHAVFRLLGIFGSLLPRPSLCSDPPPFYFIFLILFIHWLMFVIQTDAVLGKWTPAVAAAQCLTSASCGLFRGLIVSSNLVIGNTNGADYSQKTTWEKNSQGKCL